MDIDIDELAEKISQKLAARLKLPGWEEAPFKCGPLSIDYVGRVVLIERVEYRLSDINFRYLEVLTRNMDRVVTRERFLDLVYQGRKFVTDRNIDGVIVRLRALSPVLRFAIETQYGGGYSLRKDKLLSLRGNSKNTP